MVYENRDENDTSEIESESVEEQEETSSEALNEVAKKGIKKVARKGAAKKEAKKTSKTTSGTISISGLPVEGIRKFYDIYAILEAPQEIYFGEETQVNVSIIESIKIPTGGTNFIEKNYISPTKRRGIERRMLIWAPILNGQLYGDVKQCGIPQMCLDFTNCYICRIFGGLDPKGQKSIIGRLVHGGGVAIQALAPELKQRVAIPSIINKTTITQNPIPFKRLYAEGGTLYSIANHCFAMTEKEFQGVAYAFINSLKQLGAGNPKGVKIFEDLWDSNATETEPFLIVDEYSVPKGKNPMPSPFEVDIQKALTFFVSNAKNYPQGDKNFERFIGFKALERLINFATSFVSEILGTS